MVVANMTLPGPLHSPEPSSSPAVPPSSASLKSPRKSKYLRHPGTRTATFYSRILEYYGMLRERKEERGVESVSAFICDAGVWGWGGAGISCASSYHIHRVIVIFGSLLSYHHWYCPDKRKGDDSREWQLRYEWEVGTECWNQNGCDV